MPVSKCKKSSLKVTYNSLNFCGWKMWYSNTCDSDVFFIVIQEVVRIENADFHIRTKSETASNTSVNMSWDHHPKLPHCSFESVLSRCEISVHLVGECLVSPNLRKIVRIFHISLFQKLDFLASIITSARICEYKMTFNFFSAQCNPIVTSHQTKYCRQFISMSCWPLCYWFPLQFGILIFASNANDNGYIWNFPDFTV